MNFHMLFFINSAVIILHNCVEELGITGVSFPIELYLLHGKTMID